MVKVFLIAVALGLVYAFTNRLAQVRTDNAEHDLIYLSVFDAQPKADRIRICRAVMKAREAPWKRINK